MEPQMMAAGDGLRAPRAPTGNPPSNVLPPIDPQFESPPILQQPANAIGHKEFDHSDRMNPIIFPVNPVATAEWEVYAIHGLNSDANTWTWTKDRPLGSKGFNWLDKLGNALKQRGGQDVATYVVGWNTKPLSSANMSRNITDTARPLANAIVGRRGESKAVFEKNFGQNPGKTPKKVILIGHSMGGILARCLLGWMHQNRDVEYYDYFLKSVMGVILLASPSGGSDVGVVAEWMVRLAEGWSGGMSATLNPAHMRALRTQSAELAQITASFDAYCDWVNTTQRRKLIVHALRETEKTPIGPVLPAQMIVTPQSANVPQSTQGKVEWKVEDLRGLNHTQVTSFPNLDDPRLQLILASFAEMQNGGRATQPIAQPGMQQGPFPRGPGLVGGAGGAPQRTGQPVMGAPSYPSPNRVRQQTSVLQRGRQPGRPAGPGQAPAPGEFGAPSPFSTT